MAVKGLSFCPSLRTHLEPGLRAWPLLGAPWGLFRALVTEQATYLPRAPSRASSWECPSRKVLVNEKKKKKILASQMLSIRVPNGYILKPSHSHCLNVRTRLVSSLPHQRRCSQPAFTFRALQLEAGGTDAPPKARRS